jgi:Cu+-exporting ATPase
MSDPKLIELKVEGMTCTNCAQTVRRKLEKDGMQDILVDFSSGDVRFKNPTPMTEEEVAAHIDDLGYKVVRDQQDEKKNS